MSESLTGLTEEQKADKTIKTWFHSRKGLITGRIIKQAEGWVTIKLVGDQHIGYVSDLIKREVRDGETILVRFELLQHATLCKNCAGKIVWREGRGWGLWAGREEANGLSPIAFDDCTVPGGHRPEGRFL